MSWVGTVSLTPGRMVYFGTLGAIPLHSSIAVGLVLAVRGELELYNDAGEVTLLGDGNRVAVLPPGVRHAKPAEPLGTDGTCGPAEAVLAIIEPTSAAGRVLLGRLDASGGDRADPATWIAAAAPAARVVRPPGPDDPAATALVDAVLRELADSDPPPSDALHPALAKAVALIPERLAGAVRLNDLAAAVGLSPSRLGHLFGAELGLPYRAYLRWAQIQKAVECLRGGATLTETAHAAGFTDSAHLNRTCRAVFGANPSDLVRNMRWL